MRGSPRPAIRLLPRPACGERVRVRGLASCARFRAHLARGTLRAGARGGGPGLQGLARVHEEEGGGEMGDEAEIELEPVSEELPAGFEALRAAAHTEGFRQAERLANDWHAATTRFDREGEALLAARVRGGARRDWRSHH
jgi:hypothetical protein